MLCRQAAKLLWLVNLCTNLFGRCGIAAPAFPKALPVLIFVGMEYSAENQHWQCESLKGGYVSEWKKNAQIEGKYSGLWFLDTFHAFNDHLCCAADLNLYLLKFL